MSQVLKCDSCGREMASCEAFWMIDEKYTDGYGKDKVLQSGDYDFSNRDFCTECIKLINRFLTMPPEEKKKLLKDDNILAMEDVKLIEKPKRKYTKRKKNETEQPTEEIKKAAVKPLQKVDKGKVIALYNTHTWTFKQIADDVGTDVQTVRDIIKEKMIENRKIKETMKKN